MKPKIAALKALVDQFPTRKRVEYDKADDQQFVTSVLKALRAAWPDILVLAQDLEDVEKENNDLNRLLVDLANRFIKPADGETITDPLIGRLVVVTANFIAKSGYTGQVTTQSPDPAAVVQTPSNGASPEPGKEHSNHIQGESLSTDGNASASNHKSGTSGMSESVKEKLSAAKKKAATSRLGRGKKAAEASQTGKGAGSQSAQPPTTPGTAEA